MASGDVDLLITVANAEANAALAQTNNALGRIRSSGLQAVQAARGLDAAFDALGGSGKFGAENIAQLSSLLPLLGSAGPMGLAIAGAGLLTTKLFQMHQEAKKQEIAEEASRVKALADATLDAATGLRAMQKALSEGKSITEALLARDEAQTGKDFENVAANSAKRLKELQAELDGLRQKEAELNAQSPRTLAELLEKDEALQKVKKEIEETAHAMANVVVVEDQSVESFRQASIEIRNQRDAMNEACKAAEDYEEAMAEMLAQMASTMSGLATMFGDSGKEEGLPGMADGYVETTGIMVDATISATEMIRAQWEQTRAAIEGALILGAIPMFDAYADALDKTVSLNALFSESSGRAFQNAASGIARQIGHIAMIHVAEELALAATTAMNPAAAALYGPAPAHLKAAGAWAIVAGAAGVGAGLASVAPGGGSGGAPSVNGRERGGSGEGTGTQVFVTVIGTLDERGAESLAEQISSVQRRRNV